MADALSLLRQYIMQKKEFVDQDDMIVFGDIGYLKDLNTNFLIYGTGIEGKPKQYYTLGCLAYFYKQKILNHPIYVKDANSKNIPVVLRMDRKDLLAYLDGETTNCMSIDKNAPMEITMAAPIHVRASAAKRPKLEQHDNTAQLSSQSSGSQKLAGADAEEFSSALNSEIRERIAKKLESGVSAGIKIAPDQISDLSDKLTADKIKELKTIRLAKKRNTIVSGDVMDDDLPVAPVATNAVAGSADDAELMKEILGRERIWRNRVTILECVGNKSFDKNIFAILQSIKLKEEGSGLNTSGIVMGQSGSQVQPAGAAAQKSAKTLGYNRFDQERYGAKDDTGGFSINTKGTYQFNATIALGGAPETPATQVSQSQLQPQAKLGSIVNSMTKTPTASQAAKPGAATQVSSQSQSQKTRQSRKPIIIVPATRTALITIHNVVDILQDLKYVSSDEKRKNVQNANKDSEIIIHKKEDGKTIQFKVVDNANKLAKEDWDRVVAVFAQGPQWQFKEWPWDGSPNEIFSRIKGFHLKWSGTNLDPNIAKWSVSVIELDQHKRHLDRARLLAFWDELDK